MTAPLVKFKRTGARIERVECARETESSVWIETVVRKLKAGATPEIAEIRHSKTGDYTGFHDTWAEAHAALMKRAESEVLIARRSLQTAQDRFGNIKGMKMPIA